VIGTVALPLLSKPVGEALAARWALLRMLGCALMRSEPAGTANVRDQRHRRKTKLFRSLFFASLFLCVTLSTLRAGTNAIARSKSTKKQEFSSVSPRVSVLRIEPAPARAPFDFTVSRRIMNSLIQARRRYHTSFLTRRRQRRAAFGSDSHHTTFPRPVVRF